MRPPSSASLGADVSEVSPPVQPAERPPADGRLPLQQGGEQRCRGTGSQATPGERLGSRSPRVARGDPPPKAAHRSQRRSVGPLHLGNRRRGPSGNALPFELPDERPETSPLECLHGPL